MKKAIYLLIVCVFSFLVLVSAFKPDDVLNLTKKEDILKAIEETENYYVNQETIDQKDEELRAVKYYQSGYYKSRMAYLIGKLWGLYPDSKEILEYMIKRWEYSETLYIDIEKEIQEFAKKYPAQKETIKKGWFYKYHNAISWSFREQEKIPEYIKSYLTKYPDDKDAAKLIALGMRYAYRNKGLHAQLKKMLLDEFPDSEEAMEVKEEAKAEKRLDEAKGKSFELKFKDQVSGKEIDLADYKGKIVVIDFWATWCGPCVGELPNMIKLYEKYSKKNVEFIGISLDSDINKLKEFCKKKKVPWPQYCEGAGWKTAISQKWGIKSIPRIFVLDKAGKIYNNQARARLEDIIKELLKK